MTIASSQNQMLTLSPGYSEASEADLARLEALLSGSVPVHARNVQGYALAYIERYQHDVLQLEHEWHFLTMALTSAWQRQEYAAVISLVDALALPASRCPDLAEAERILRLGIAASRHTRDKRHLASFLNRLGGLLFAQGQCEQGRRTWYAGFRIARSADYAPGVWLPLSSFAMIFDILGNYAAAQQFMETFQQMNWLDDPDSFMVALFVRGLSARLIDQPERAYADLNEALRLVMIRAVEPSFSPFQQLFCVVVQAELARIQGDYMRAQMYTETALALARTFSDPYTYGDLLIDQGLFVYQQGNMDDLVQVFQRLNEVAQQVVAPHFRLCCHFLERQLVANGKVSDPLLTLAAPTSQAADSGGLLSEREKEVLVLVAQGLSNREIADNLVITRGTVKKHLEHIYTRLDVHNRTSALLQARALRILP